MRQFLNSILTIIFTIYSCFVFAQVDTSLIVHTKSYVKYIDSINKLDYVREQGFVTSIADGIIKRDNLIIGGFGIYTLSNQQGDTAFRIEYHDNLEINIYKIYYYRDNKLVYATVELQDGRNNMAVLYHKEEFYDNDKIIRTTARQKKKANKYFGKINYSMYSDGLEFLNDFKKKK
jgi:hypothetical protein